MNKLGMIRAGDARSSPDFWIRDVDIILMSQNDIEKYNTLIRDRVKDVVDLRTLPDKEEVLKSMISYDLSGVYYRGRPLNEKILMKIKKRIDADGFSGNFVYGITVRNTDLRKLPVEVGMFREIGDKEFDVLQETALELAEPLIILHKSRDRKWFFVQTRNYRGWVRSKDIALAERKDLFDYIERKEFLMVTGDRVFTQPNPYERDISMKEMVMGTRVPVIDSKVETVDGQSTNGNFVIELPCKRKGEMDTKPALISMREDVSLGYIPYTVNNIIKQVFKFLWHRYGWGDGFSGIDCSGLVMRVFKTFGITLPRNTWQQERCPGKTVEIKGEESLKTVLPGSALYMPGHVAIYLGEADSRNYIIHAFHGYFDGLRFIKVNEVAVTTVDLMRSDGKRFVDCFTKAIAFTF